MCMLLLVLVDVLRQVVPRRGRSLCCCCDDGPFRPSHQASDFKIFDETLWFFACREPCPNDHTLEVPNGDPGFSFEVYTYVPKLFMGRPCPVVFLFHFLMNIWASPHFLSNHPTRIPVHFLCNNPTNMTGDPFRILCGHLTDGCWAWFGPA